MGFRDDRDAQRLKIDALERQLEEARAEAQKAKEERDRARRERDAPRSAETSSERSGPYEVGSAVYVEWKGRWWDARVLEIVAEHAWKIRYEGWSESWDEIVGPARIAPRTGPRPRPLARTGGWLRALALLIGSAGAIAFVFARSSSVEPPSSIPERAIPVSELVPGRAVWIEWNGGWYAGSVLALESSDRVRVHYDGWAEAFDESVPLSRLRLR